MVPLSCADFDSNPASYPGSDLSTSQLLAALDRRMPAEIAWAESNARSKGVLIHFRKPEVRNCAPFIIPPLDVISPRR